MFPLGYASWSTICRPRFLANSAVPLAAVFGKSVSSFTMAIVLSPRLAAMSTSPSRYTSAGEMIMKMYLRPFLKIEVVAASGATITFLCFSVTFATASVIAEEYGPITTSTLSSVMSFSYRRTPVAGADWSS